MHGFHLLTKSHSSERFNINHIDETSGFQFQYRLSVPFANVHARPDPFRSTIKIFIRELKKEGPSRKSRPNSTALCSRSKSDAWFMKYLTVGRPHPSSEKSLFLRVWMEHCCCCTTLTRPACAPEGLRWNAEWKNSQIATADLVQMGFHGSTSGVRNVGGVSCKKCFALCTREPLQKRPARVVLLLQENGGSYSQGSGRAPDRLMMLVLFLLESSMQLFHCEKRVACSFIMSPSFTKKRRLN